MILATDPHHALARERQTTAELIADFRRAFVADHRDHAADHRQVRHQLRVGRSAVEALGIFLGNEAGRDIARAEARVLHQRREEIDIVADAVDHEWSSASTCASIAASRVGAQVTSLAIIGS